MKEIIKVCHLKHHFGENVVLNDIDLQIMQGEIFGLLGPSGTGKTTLIKVLTGQLHPTQGSTELFETDSKKLMGKDYANMGIMMESFGLYERLSCYDNLKMFAMLHQIPLERIQEALYKVGLSEASKREVSHLSKGMRSRMLLARAILGAPKLLFLDEPTSGLDPMTAEEIHKLILEEKQKGTTIFLTTHNMAEAEKLCDNVALLNEGRIVEYGNPKKVCRKYNHQRKLQLHLYDGTDVELQHDKSCLDKLVMYVQKEAIETIHSTEPNLETVFMELTGRGLE